MNYLKFVTENLDRIKKAYMKLDPTWHILDVGGGDQPIKLATHVIDLQPFNKVGRTGVMGMSKEEARFTKKTWIQMNMCDGPWPFPDKFFDYVWCTQTLEDIRDPIFVCKEMSRVGKAGYINCPGKVSELIIGISKDPMANFFNGFFHHRWLVSKGDEDKLIFTHKNAYATNVQWVDQEMLQILEKHPELGYLEQYWHDNITAEEKVFIDATEAVEDLRGYIDSLKIAFKDSL